jgi:hypothetical protein
MLDKQWRKKLGEKIENVFSHMARVCVLSRMASSVS